VLRFNLEAAPDRYAEVARALGVTDGGSAEAVARRGLERIVALARACGLPRGLAELGIRREDLPELARSAMQVQRLLRNNLRPVTETDARAIYEAAF
jgi:alcohol dehydrogenase class IV